MAATPVVETRIEASGRETGHEAGGRETGHQASGRETGHEAGGRETGHQALSQACPVAIIPRSGLTAQHPLVPNPPMVAAWTSHAPPLLPACSTAASRIQHRCPSTAAWPARPTPRPAAPCSVACATTCAAGPLEPRHLEPGAAMLDAPGLARTSAGQDRAVLFDCNAHAAKTDPCCLTATRMLPRPSRAV